jgi:type I restriction enzyme, R subunit
VQQSYKSAPWSDHTHEEQLLRPCRIKKKQLSERDICTKFIAAAEKKAGWGEMSQIREEVSFTKGYNIVRGKLVRRGNGKRAGYIL